MPRKSTSGGLGKGITNDHRRRAEKLVQQAAQYMGVSEDKASRSVLEQSSLDELLATVEVRQEEYDAATGEAEIVDGGAILLSPAEVVRAERKAEQDREVMSIPRRPQWKEGMAPEELTVLEAEAFMDWRRGLATLAQEMGLYLTPYERNLDFWRQLWRCIERSDLVVQIVDARDPDFYRCADLARYVAEVDSSKRLVLLLNKADFLTAEQRRQWAEHFKECGVDAIFFSALHELKVQQKQQQQLKHELRSAALKADDGPIQPDKLQQEDEDVLDEAPSTSVPVDFSDIPVPSSDESEGEGADSGAKGSETKEEEDPTDGPLGVLAESDKDVVDSSMLLQELMERLPAGDDRPEKAATGRRGTIGFVGFPNVGKSTVINALIGAKKVAMSKRPGKTKHIQTLEMPEQGITLCDCPGLVFPSVVATKAHLVINNTVPLDDLQECWTPVGLIVEKMGLGRVLKAYNCAGLVRDAALRSGDHVLNAAHSFLAALAVSRHHFLRVGVPDENWAARKVLRDYVRGALLHCEPPPRAREESGDGDGVAESSDGEAGGVDLDPDFGDVGAFLHERTSQGGIAVRSLTKRKVRYLQKQQLRGAPIKPVKGHDLGQRAKGKLAIPV